MKGTNSNQHRQSLYSKLDLFGIGYNFMINGQDKYKTNTGASLTILLSFILIALFMGFGVNLYQRNSPNVSMNSEIGEYTKINLTNSNFTYAYRIEDTNGDMLIDPTILHLEVFHIHYVYNVTLNTWQEIFINQMEPTRCYDIEGIKEKEELLNFSLKNWYCMDFKDNFKMGGNWDGNFTYSWQVNTIQCTNSTENNNTCKSQEEIESILQNDQTAGNLFYSYLYLDVVPFMDNYDNPLSNTLIDHYEMLSLKTAKRNIQLSKLYK